jgi:hypothetical protein
VRDCSDLSAVNVHVHMLGLNFEMKSTHTSRGQEEFPYRSVKSTEMGRGHQMSGRS